MNVALFKPNSKNTGSLGDFRISQKGSEEPIFYLRLTAQASWDDNKRLGTFSENIKNPSKTVSVKFNEFELGEILNAFDRDSAWSSFHDFNDKLSISLKPWQKTVGKGDNARQYTAFGLSITRNGSDTFKLPIEPGEAVRLRGLVKTYYEWLDEARRVKFLAYEPRPQRGNPSAAPSQAQKEVEPAKEEPSTTDEPDF
jgi:hypothetical protein